MLEARRLSEKLMIVALQNVQPRGQSFAPFSRRISHGFLAHHLQPLPNRAVADAERARNIADAGADNSGRVCRQADYRIIPSFPLRLG
jgi:hypothetical protein